MNRTPVLFLNVLILATCGLVYELLAGTLASYVLGDSVTQFSLVIGIYLFAMGAGAWLSRFVDQALVRCFVEVEFGVALLGGCSAPLLLLSFARLSCFSVVLYGAVFAIGVLVGLELPLLRSFRMACQSLSIDWRSVARFCRSWPSVPLFWEAPDAWPLLAGFPLDEPLADVPAVER